MKYVKKIFMVYILFVVLYFAFATWKIPNNFPSQLGSCIELPLNWEVVNEDGSRTPPQENAFLEKAEQDVILETVLPSEMEDGHFLCFFLSRQDAQFYIGDELRAEYKRESTSMFGNNGAALLYFVGVRSEDAGRVLRVVTRCAYNKTSVFEQVYYGSRIGIWKQYVFYEGPEFILALVTMVLGIVVILLIGYMNRYFKQISSLQWLGWGILISALWVVTNAYVRQLIFPNLAVLSDIPFYLDMMIPLPFSVYVDSVQKERYHKRYMIVVNFAMINFAVCTVLNITGVAEFAKTFPVTAVSCGLMMVAVISSLIQDLITKRILEYKIVAIGIAGAILGGFLQLLSYVLNADSTNKVMMDFALAFLLLAALINATDHYLKTEHEKAQAVASEEAKTRFLARMSHEIRTPINAVIGMDNMIMRESREKNIQDYAKDIYSASTQLLAIINDILDFSKIGAGKMELVNTEYNLGSIINDTVNLMLVNARDKKLEYIVDVEDTLPTVLYGDPVRIRQILLNLLSNAVKYTEKGSVTFRMTGTVDGEWLQLHVEVNDTGIGMKKEHMDKLFAEFERIDEEKHRDVQGTGLGISITEKLLQMMDSGLKVNSEYGKGSSFSFDLRQKIIDSHPIGERSRTEWKEDYVNEYQAEFTAPNAQILVVDDNELNRRVFCNLLKQTGIQIDQAASGKECLNLVHKKKYDVIFLDDMMPEIDGVETLKIMKASGKGTRNAETPVVALTANALEGAREWYLERHFDDFLSKPIVPKRLETMLQRLLPTEKLRTKTKEEPKEEEEVLPEVAGVNWQYALQFLEDKGLLKKTAVHFCRLAEKEAQGCQQEFDTLLSKGDEESLRVYQIKVHAMKSNAASIGAMPVSGVALMLENAAKEGNITDIKNVTPVFLKEWRGLADRLSRAFMQETAGEKPMPVDDLKKTLLELNSAMRNRDIDSADDIMEYLKGFFWEKGKKELFHALEEAVISLNASTVEELTGQLMSGGNEYGENRFFQ